jgi:hypothetical protein
MHSICPGTRPLPGSRVGQREFIKFKKDCNITDASSFLSCAVLGEDLKHQEPDVPRP